MPALARAPRVLAAATALAIAVAATHPPVARAADCTVTQTGMIPLTELGAGTHKGEPGGLYPGGLNAPPPAHHASALAAAAHVVPRDAAGGPDGAGKIVLLSVGMSNTTQEFSAFVRTVGRDPRVSPRLSVVDGAQGGQTAADIRDPSARFWTVVDQRLGAAGATPDQVQAIWLKEANRQPGADRNPDTLLAARRLADDLEGVVAVARERFPNLALVYLSSRIYAGYASTALNPEPYAYESALAVRWLIERQMGGAPELDPAAGAPVLLWGPYLWADGLTPRADGLTWACTDLQQDGTHPSDSGRAKVAEMLMGFFAGDDTSAGWFLADPGAPEPTPAMPSATASASATMEPQPSATEGERPSPTATSGTPGLENTPTPRGTASVGRYRVWFPWGAR